MIPIARLYEVNLNASQDLRVEIVKGSGEGRSTVMFLKHFDSHRLAHEPTRFCHLNRYCQEQRRRPRLQSASCALDGRNLEARSGLRSDRFPR